MRRDLRLRLRVARPANGPGGACVHASSSGPAPPGWRQSALRLRGGYFWHYAGVGTFSPFAALYYRELGFSGIEVGLLTALPAISSGLFGAFMGAFADARGAHRLVLRAALALAIMLALALSQVSAFIGVLLVMALLAVSIVPVMPLLDSYGMTITERTGISYGSMRVWGSIGFMATSLGVGRLLGERVSAAILLAYACCFALTLVSIYGLPALAERQSRSLLAGLGDVRRNRPLLLLLLVGYLLASGAAIMYTFLGIHIQDMGGSASLVGLAFALSAFSELPIVAFGGWFLARFGPFRLICLALVVFAVRFAAFSAITVPEWILPVQMLHGLSYGAYLMASVTLAHRTAGRAHAATAQALLASVSFGFGAITGSLLGGALLDAIGTTGLFRLAAALMLLALGVLVTGNRLVGLDRHEAVPAPNAEDAPATG
jgi:PPP family 3-phenylpropionic acid transporter